MFRGGETCFYNIIPQDYLGHPDYEYTLEIKVNNGERCQIEVLNGTSLETADDLFMLK